MLNITVHYTHFTSARQRYAPVTQTDKNENWIERVTEMEKKKKKKKKKKFDHDTNL